MAGDDTVSARIKELRRKRGSLKAKLTALRKYIDNLPEEPDLNQISSRKEQLSLDKSTFDHLQSELELIVEDDNTEAEYKERSDYEDIFFAYESKISRLLGTNFTPPANVIAPAVERNVSVSESTRVASAGASADFKPLQMLLPTFEGKESEQWSTFSASFRVAIHQNDAYSGTQKLIYLRTCLKGKALQKIESLHINDANYKVAWDLLEEAYFDFQSVVEKLVKSFFHLPQCKKPCSSELGALIDEASRSYRALEALDKSYLHIFPMHAIISKLDEQTRLKWKETAILIENPTMDNLINFLNNRRRVLSDATSGENKADSNDSGKKGNAFKHNHSKSNNQSSTLIPNIRPPFCQLCKQAHHTYACDKLLNASPKDRFTIVKTANLCLNCLRANHSVKDCRITTRCKSCGKNHHSLLHFENTNSNLASGNTTNLTAVVESHVILSTAVVHLIDKWGYPHACRALLDSGAQSNFITRSIADKLGLEQFSTDVSVVGVNQIHTKVNTSINVQLQSRINKFSTELSFLILPRITERLPNIRLPRGLLKIPSNHPLADPKFHEPAEIDLLIGAELFYKLLCVGQVELTNGSSVLQKTLLGWVVTGKMSNLHHISRTACHVATDSLYNKVEKFWEIEECPKGKILSDEESACELHFEKNVTRDPTTGRYTVRLPFNNKQNQLGDSYTMALRRFNSLERNLNKRPEQYEQYREFLAEYKSLGHMSEFETDDYSGFYLPHHAVIKQASLSTKIRVVFDASAKSSSGLSLNDTLMVGPTIQDDLFSILLRFRMHVYVLTADIEKMYRQVDVHADDRNFQKILFRFSPNEPVKTYKLNTVTYGTSAAPFLATRVLKQLALDESLSHPLASEVLANDFYVDDLLTGAKTMNEVKNIRDELIEITKKGRMNLRKFASNEAHLVGAFDNSAADPLLCLNLDETVKTLGIAWNARSDSITYKSNVQHSKTKITKRSILSHIASLFDPLGLLGPIITKAKLIMQNLWKLRLDWDESVPIEVQTSWAEFCSELGLINSFSISRRVVSRDYATLQLHGFCDASEKAYGSCLYVRSMTADGQVEVHLLCSKSRVAPLKSISLPRLELCAAQLLANLYTTAAQALSRFSFERVVLWSDSTIVLHWLNTQPHKLKTFVGNRVSEIQKLTNHCEWYHVKSEDNPADVISRGTSPSEFSDRYELWTNGPTWLRDSQESWPIGSLEHIEIPEQKTTVVTKCFAASTKAPNFILSRSSSFSKLRRVLAYCLRFIRNCRYKMRATPCDIDYAVDDWLTTGELKNATNLLFKLVQLEAYPNEIKLLKEKRPLTGHVIALAPFVDANGLIRVGGRLRHSDLPYAQKHPILLPSDHHITLLVIEYEHLKNLHAPVHATLNATRQYVWIVDGRNAVKGVLRKCVSCFRSKPVTPNCIMGDLPKSRTLFIRPFLQVGVDLCGHFYIKEKRHRNRNKIKVYLAVFVCFSTRAVHIEIVEDLTTEAFLASFRRFCARRGKPSDVHSDNAGNFGGCKRELDEINQFLNSRNTEREILAETANNGINWHFIPPRSPHFGGLWEAAVKSLKRHLLQSIGNTLISYEALHTLSVEVEGILNSRPLTPLSSDPNDLETLTPFHFLIGDSLNNIPEYDFLDTPINKLSLWQHTQRMKQHFWTRWRREYLNELNTRSKWHTGAADNLKIGQIVILHDENLPVNQWKLARIVATHPDDLGKVRVVSVKTAAGEYKRTIKKISPLPIDCES